LPSHGFRRVGVVGVGVVGGAVRDYLEGEGIRPLLYDRDKRLGSQAEVDQADLVFVCVPTPYRPVVGFDDSAVDDAIASLSGAKTVVLKSTVLPGMTEKYQRRYPQHTVLFNPEFLRDKTAVADFLEPDRQIVGYCRSDEAVAAEVLRLLPRAPHEAVVPAAVAEMAKYATNAFLAMKVVFANELFDLAQALNIDYAQVRVSLAADLRIGGSHLEVLDGGYRGYGGKCLPKDTMALLDLAEDLGVEMRLLEAAHEVNSRLKAPVPMRRQPAAFVAEAAGEVRSKIA